EVRGRAADSRSLTRRHAKARHHHQATPGFQPQKGSHVKTLTTITARPAGRDRHGNPIRTYRYVVDERREDWGDNRTRIFVRRPDLDARSGQQCFVPEVVLTDSIAEAAA